MKQFYAHLLAMYLVLLPLVISAQCIDNNPDNVGSQQELDDYLATNPDCTVLDELELSGNITDLSGLSHITRIDWFYFNDLPLLTDLTGLHNIDTIGGNLGFYDTEGITNFCGFESLRYIGQDLRVDATVSIKNFIGFSDLRVEDDVEIDGNQALTSLDGLETVTFSEVQVTGNPLLTDCCGIQDFLNAGFFNEANIENNAFPCNSDAQIIVESCSFEEQHSCETVMTSSCIENTPYNVTGQQELDDYLAANPNCTEIVELELNGDISDLTGLAHVTRIDWFYINNCPQLTDLSGLENIDTIGGNLGILNNEGLINLCGLENIQYIGQDLRLRDCISIENLVGLNPDLVIEGQIELVANTNLKSLDGLQGIVASELQVDDNPLLEDCCGIKELLNSGNLSDIDIENNVFSCNSAAEIMADPCTSDVATCESVGNGIASSVYSDLGIFPNPANDFIQFDNPSNVQIDEVKILNSVGQVVVRREKPGLEAISISHLAKGMYFAILKVEGQKVSRKVLIN